MSIVKHNPFHSLFRDHFMSNFDNLWHGSEFWSSLERKLAQGHFSTGVEMHRTEEKVSYYIDMPGVKRDNLTLTQEGNQMRVRAERKHSSTNTTSTLETQFSIDRSCDVETLDAQLIDGVLTISFRNRRVEKPEPKRIEVK